MLTRFVSAPIEVPSDVRLVILGSGDREEWIVGDRPPAREYDPMSDVPDLYFRFAKTEGNSVSAVAFAQAYGIPDIFDKKQKPRAKFDFAVRLALFQARTWELDFILKLHIAICNDDLSFLTRYRKYITEASQRYRQWLARSLMPRDGPRWLDFVRSHPEALDSPDANQRRDPLAEAVMLIETTIKYYTVPVWFETAYDQLEGVRHHAFVKGFLPTIYAQVAEAFQPGNIMDICKACGKPFPKTRKDKVYCDPACGSRFRMRKSRDKGSPISGQ